MATRKKTRVRPPPIITEEHLAMAIDLSVKSYVLLDGMRCLGEEIRACRELLASRSETALTMRVNRQGIEPTLDDKMSASATRRDRERDRVARVEKAAREYVESLVKRARARG